MRSKRFIIPILASSCVFALAPLTAQARQAANGAVTAAAAAPASVAPDYRLDTDDTISVGVTRHADVAGTFRVPPDGLIYLPRLVTPIEARGKTCPELVGEITRKLTEEGKLVLRPGQVNVSVVSTRMRRVYIRGTAVRGGGSYDLKNGWRVADLIAVAGGDLPQSDRVTRALLSNPQRSRPVEVDLDAALTHPDSPDNIALQEGDTLTLDVARAKRLLVKGEGPRGLHEIDGRFGLKQALLSLGFSTNGATGDLRRARLIRNAVPGDAASATTYIPVNLLTLMSDDRASDVAFQDLDTLDIPISEDYVYVLGEVTGGQRKIFLAQDRKTYLMDVVTQVGDVTPQAKIGDIKVFRKKAAAQTTPDKKGGEAAVAWEQKSYDLGKFLKSADPKQNPEILPGDYVVVPLVKHPDVVGSVWQGFGLYNILKTFMPGLR